MNMDSQEQTKSQALPNSSSIKNVKKDVLLTIKLRRVLGVCENETLCNESVKRMKLCVLQKERE